MVPELRAPLLPARLIKFVSPDVALAEQARSEYERVLNDARQEAESIREAARAEARTMLANVDAQIKANADRLIAARIVDARAALTREIGELRPGLATILRQALEKLIGERYGDQAFARVVEHALDSLAQRVATIVRANPGDVPALERRLAARGADPTRPRISIEPDSSLAQGQATLVAGGVVASIDLTRQLDLFERLARGEATT